MAPRPQCHPPPPMKTFDSVSTDYERAALQAQAGLDGRIEVVFHRLYLLAHKPSLPRTRWIPHRPCIQPYLFNEPTPAREQERRPVIGVGACLPVRQAHPFDGFDRLPFDKLRVCDTAGRLRMTLSGSRTGQGPERSRGTGDSPPRYPPSPGLPPSPRLRRAGRRTGREQARSYSLHVTVQRH